MNSQTSAKILESLASSIRLDLYRLLVRAEPEGKVAGQIADELNLPASNLSFHLKALVHSGLISVTQEGRFLRYRANLGLMNELISFLTNECCNGHPEYCANCATLIPADSISVSGE